MAQIRTPTETLMAALGEFGYDEPLECIVIFTTQEGDICNSSSTNSLSLKLGMVESISEIIRSDLRKLREGSR